jgi:hypothetical protein
VGGKEGHLTVTTIFGKHFRQTHLVEKEVYEFVATYGTHIITEMKLGSKFIYERTLEKKEVKDMESSGVDVSLYFILYYDADH